jgi:hypothetical protein
MIKRGDAFMFHYNTYLIDFPAACAKKGGAAANR